VLIADIVTEYGIEIEPDLFLKFPNFPLIFMRIDHRKVE